MPAPTVLTPAFRISSSVLNDSQPSVMASLDGRFGVYWSTFSGTNYDTRGYIYMGSVVGSDGLGQINPTDVLGNSTLEAERNPSASFYLISNSVVAYEKVVDGNTDIYFDARTQLSNGSYLTTISGQLVNGGLTRGGQFQPKVASSTLDGFIVAWEDVVDTTVNVQVFNNAGGKVGPLSIFLSSSPQMQDSNEIDVFATLSNEYIVSYVGIFNNGPRAVFSVVNIFGTVVRENVVISSSGSTTDSSEVGVAQNSSGVTCFAFSQGSDTVIRTFGLAYSPLTNDIILTNSSNTGDTPKVAALSDGRFMVIYSSSLNGPLVGQVVNVFGMLDGGAFLISQTGYQGDLETLADGRVLVSWRQDGTGNGDVYAAIYDPRETGVTLSGTFSSDNYVGSNFADNITGGGGSDTVFGGLGADDIKGGSGSDTLYGGAGNNTIDGGSDADLIVGGSGDELLQGGGGSTRDTIFGENGNDRLYSGTLSSPSLANAQSVLVGGNGNDSLYGSQGADYLYGGNDDDSLEGGAGLDVLVGGSGSDTMRGGDGNDVSYSGIGANAMYGDAGDDVFISEGETDLMEGGVGHNYYYRFATGSAQINGGTGIDEFVGGSAASNDMFFGNDGQDYAFGGNGDDVLIGQGGADVLIGQSGNDTLEGGAGVNLLWANDDGNDQIRVVESDGGTQVVEFFEAGGSNDVVRLIGPSLTSFADFDVLRTNIGSAVGNNLLINAGSGAQLYLNLGANQTAIWFQGVSAYSLTSGDFLFG